MLNEEVRRRLGGLHSADCLLRSVDFADIEQLQLAGDWDAVGARLADEAQALVAGGAEIVLLCANTMHKVAPAISSSIDVPFVHIVDTVAEAIVAAKVGASACSAPPTRWRGTSTSGACASATALRC